jgi:hypothetical protein
MRGRRNGGRSGGGAGAVSSISVRELSPLIIVASHPVSKMDHTLFVTVVEPRRTIVIATLIGAPMISLACCNASGSLLRIIIRLRFILTINILCSRRTKA